MLRMKMKNKRIVRRNLLRTAGIWLLCLVLLGGCAMPAFAQSKEPKETEAEEESSKKKNKKNEDDEQEETSDPVIDRSGLTPDGNMDLVDDLNGEDVQDIEFLTVTTRSNHTFYIVIEKGKETKNVHFLNQVDEADLMELMSEEEKERLVQEQEEAAESEKEELFPPVQNIPQAAESASQTETSEEPVPQEQKPSGLNSLQLLLVLAGISAAIGGALYYLLKVRPGKNRQYYDEDIEFEDDPEYENEDGDDSTDSDSAESQS